MNGIKTSLLVRAWIAGWLLACAPLVVAAPCTTATPDCTEWITVAGGPMRSMAYRSHTLEVRNEGITRALVVVHGGSRDAHTNFMHTLAAAFLSGALDNTVIVSPRFASNHEAIAKTLSGEDAVAAARAPARDALATGELNWVSQFGGRRGVERENHVL